MNSIYTDFDTYSRALVESKDVDPSYHMIRYVVTELQFEPVWFCFVYTSFYNMDSAIKFCTKVPTAEDFNMKRFLELRETINKFGTERKGTLRIKENQYKGLARVKEAIITDELDLGDYDKLFTTIRSFPFHGAWAVYKITEILAKAFDVDTLKFKDMNLANVGIGESYGTVGGLMDLFGRNYRYENWIIPYWEKFGARVSERYGMNIEEVESCLCKFHKMVGGRYFIGHDIQKGISLQKVLKPSVYEEMMSEFPGVFWQGKTELEKNLRGVYKHTGEIVYSKDFLSKHPYTDIRHQVQQTMLETMHDGHTFKLIEND